MGVNMKTYEVEFLRSSYVTFIVEADSAHEAGAKAWEAVAQEPDSYNVNWEIESIEES